MADIFLGEIRTFAFGRVPSGWARCEGQVLSISQHSALFALIGTTYGGDGRSTFALPDLRGRVAIGTGATAAGSSFALGERGGEETHHLTEEELPARRHRVYATVPEHSPALVAARNGHHVNDNGQGEAIAAPVHDRPHTIMQPYLALNACISLFGEFPVE
jgi:microcystin-dependent protein